MTPPDDVKRRQRGSRIDTAVGLVRAQWTDQHLDELWAALQEPMPVWEPDALPEVHVFPEDAA